MTKYAASVQLHTRGRSDEGAGGTIPELPRDTVLHGRYRIAQVLGKGGFGVVYLAEDAESGNAKFAIKEFFPRSFAYRSGNQVMTNEGEPRSVFVVGRKAFEREAALLRTHKPANVVVVFDCFEENGTSYMVMEYLAGQTMKELIPRKRTPDESGMENSMVDEDRIRGWLNCLLKALTELHEKSIWHQDISPGNIFICTDEKPVLIDFGAARQSVGQESHTLHAVANPGYSAVEIYAEDATTSLSPAPDIYGLGATFYHLITGTRPTNALARLKKSTLAPLTECAKGRYDHKLLASIDKAMAVSASDRWSTAAEWRDAILFPDPLLKPLWCKRFKDIGKSRWVWIIGAIVVAIVLYVILDPCKRIDPNDRPFECFPK